MRRCKSLWSIGLTVLMTVAILLLTLVGPATQSAVAEGNGGPCLQGNHCSGDTLIDPQPAVTISDPWIISAFLLAMDAMF